MHCSYKLSVITGVGIVICITAVSFGVVPLCLSNMNMKDAVYSIHGRI